MIGDRTSFIIKYWQPNNYYHTPAIVWLAFIEPFFLFRRGRSSYVDLVHYEYEARY